MRYVKSLCLNFLIIFFADYLLPGVEVMDQTKLFHFKGDLLFPLVLGIANTLIFPCLKWLHRPSSIVRMGVAGVILNFIAYAVLKFLPTGIHVATIEGYIILALVVSVGTCLVNYWELKHQKKQDFPSHRDLGHTS